MWRLDHWLCKDISKVEPVCIVAMSLQGVGILQVYGHQSLVEQLLLDLDFSWTGNQKFQLRVSHTTCLQFSVQNVSATLHSPASIL